MVGVRLVKACAFFLLVVSPNTSSAFAQTVVRDSTVLREGGVGTQLWLDAGVITSRQLFQVKGASAMSVGAGTSVVTSRSALILDGVAINGDRSSSAFALRGVALLSPFDSQRTATQLSISSLKLRSVDNVNERNGSYGVRQLLRFSTKQAALTVFADATKGKTVRPNLHSFFGTSVGVGSSVDLSSTAFSFRWQRLRTNDYPLVESSGDSLVADASAYDYDQFSVAVHRRINRLVVSAVGDIQRARSATGGSVHNAITGSAYYLFNRNITLVASAGHSLFDVVNGQPEARVASFTVRYTHSSASATLPREREATLELPPITGGELVLRIVAPRNAKVEVAGSHNSWRVQRMEYVSGAFVSRVSLTSGTHHIAVRVNGGKWRAPFGLVRITDDLGGEAGIVIVP